MAKFSNCFFFFLQEEAPHPTEQPIRERKKQLLSFVKIDLGRSF